MAVVSRFVVAITMLFFANLAFSQQLRLGKDPYAVEKSAVLELYSDNQGLLLPRLTDTSLINVLNPPDGMIIYFVPEKKLLIRANGYWQGLAVNDSVVTSLNGHTGALTMDTGYISNFSQKVRGLLSAGSGISYDANTGIISSSINTGNFWNTSGNAGTNSSTNFIGTTDNQDLVFKANNTEMARIVASTGDIKIGSATTGTLRATDELVLRQDGDTYGSSILRLRNRTNENGAIFETTDPSVTLVDFIFKTAASQRNIRYEARAGYAKAGTPSFHIGGASPDNPTLAVGDDYAAFNTNLKIGNYNTPTEALDVTGNVRFSGALMPNNDPGTSGYILQSNGSSTAPTWKNFTLSNLNDVSLSSPSNGQLLQYNGTNWVNTTPSYLTSIDTSNISNFYLKVRSLLSATAPITYNSSTGAIGITKASSSTNGYLSSTDWNTFNNKANSFSTGNLTETGSNILTITGGANSVIGSGTTIQVKQAGASQSGFLSSTDWNTFNNKLSSIDTSNISNFYLKVRKELSAGTGISYNNNTGVITNSGVTALNGNTGALTMDTSYISNFYSKVRNELSAGTGISYNASTGVISSSINSGNFWTLGGNAVGSTQNLGTTNNNILPFITNNAERMRIDNYGRVGIGITDPANPLVVKDTLEIRRTGSMSELLFSNTAGSGDFRIAGDGGDLFWQGGGGRILQMGSYWTTVLGGDRRTTVFPAFTGGGSNTGVLVQGQRDASVPLGIQANSASQSANLTEWRNSSGTALSVVDKNGNFGIGSLTPSEALDVTGNVRFSGALMPNNNAGTSGYILQSNGSGTAPTWKNFTLSNLNDVSLSSPSNGQLLQYNGTNWVNTTPSYLSSVDTSNISNFYLKVRKELSATAPITYNSSTGAIGITQASSSTNGYLSSTDWNTFNNKASAYTFSTGLTNTSNTITNNLSTGISSSNQNIYGSTASGGTLTLNSTTNGTKGKILFGNSSAYDETNNYLSIGTTTSQNRITIGGNDQEAISRDTRTGSLEIMGGNSESTGAYFQITGDQHTGSPYEGSAEFVIRNLSNSQFAMFSYDGGSSWTQRFQLKGSSGDTYLTPNGGKVSIGGITPTASLHLPAGTASANTAPLKFTAGTNLSTPEDGAIEYNGTHFYATIGSTRYQLDQQSGASGLGDPGGNGIVARTSLNTTTNRTITGTSNRTTVTNGDGVSGNPTIDISSSYAGQSSITTLGTVATGTWNANTISIAHGGTGQTTANAALNALLPSQSGNSGQVLTTDGTNTSWSSPSVTGANFVYAYSTSTKTFSSAGSWSDITFNTSQPQIDGWSHSLSYNSQNFTCNQSGIYQIVYSGQVNNNSPNNTYEIDVRAELNGSEVAGSVSSVQCSDSNPTIANNFLVSVNSGDVLKLQLTGSNTNMRLQAGAYGSVKPTITITIIRIQ